MDAGTGVTDQSGGITVTSLGVGVRCVVIPGLVADSSTAVASIDWLNSPTGGSVQSFVEVGFTPGACPANAMGVRTWTRDFSVAGAPFTNSNVPFYLMVTP